MESGHFFKAKQLLKLFTFFLPTGHTLGPDGKILGDPASLPWGNE
jgi:hypothetical protein